MYDNTVFLTFPILFFIFALFFIKYIHKYHGHPEIHFILGAKFISYIIFCFIATAFVYTSILLAKVQAQDTEDEDGTEGIEDGTGILIALLVAFALIIVFFLLIFIKEIQFEYKTKCPVQAFYDRHQ